MLVAGVDVRLGADLRDAIEVVYVDVDEDAKEATQQLLARRLERLGKGHAHSGRKYERIVDLLVHPVHEQLDVLGRRQLGRLLVLIVVAPQVLVLGSARHHRTRVDGAVVRHDAVQQIDAIEEVHDVHGQPVVEVFAARQLDRLAEIEAGVERVVGHLVQVVAHRSRLHLLLRPKRLRNKTHGEGHEYRLDLIYKYDNMI